MKTHKGFTIIELLTVIILLGILSAVAVPKFFTQSAFDERFFFDDALNSLRYAQQLAVSKGCHTQFSLNGSRFILNSDSQCGVSSTITLAGVINRPATGDSYQNTDVPSSVTSIDIVFDPEGRAGTVSAGNFSVFSATQNITIGGFSFQIDGVTGFARES